MLRPGPDDSQAAERGERAARQSYEAREAWRSARDRVVEAAKRNRAARKAYFSAPAWRQEDDEALGNEWALAQSAVDAAVDALLALTEKDHE